eukprot:GSChrysophyteH1.ASY1.ANO1.17.1 assembled CDS
MSEYTGENTIGKPIQCKAAVAHAVNDLKVEIIEVDVPKPGEVRLKVISNALYRVIPCYTPECREKSCIFCENPKTNLLYHFMGCSTFSEYTVVAEISCAKINTEAPLDKVCLFGCGVSTGLGAVWKTCDVQPNTTVAVFGLGAVGLSVIQACKSRGCSRIFAIDLNPAKFEMATSLGATDCINVNNLPAGQNIQQYIVSLTTWECVHRGWGTSCVIGVAPAGHEISTRPFQLVTGRTWKGTAFGGFKSRSEVPTLVDKYMDNSLPIDHFITHTFQGIEAVQDAVALLHDGSCLRAVVKY